MILYTIIALAVVATNAIIAIAYLLEDDDEPWVDPTWRSYEDRKWD
jgi:hypothetical protein